jgi:hypothetical protein
MLEKLSEQKPEPRDIKITVRLNPEELKILDNKRGIVPRATFFRKNLIHAKIPAGVPKINQKAYLETARWAANLNQISHFFHMHGDEIPARGTEEIYSYLKKFRGQLIGLDFSGDEKDEA